MSLFEINYLFFSNQIICIFLFVIENMLTTVLAASFSPHFLWRLQVKLVPYLEFMNTFSEKLRTYTFLEMIFIVGEIKSITLKVWKIKSRIGFWVIMNCRYWMQLPQQRSWHFLIPYINFSTKWSIHITKWTVVNQYLRFTK